MLVDTLLKYFGENPAAYRDSEGKWITISIYIFDFIASILPAVLFSIPWCWLFWRKKIGKKIERKLIIKVVLVSVGLGALGFMLPDWIIGIIAGLAVNSIY